MFPLCSHFYLSNVIKFIGMATIFDYSNRDVTVTLMRKEREKGDDVAPIFWRITYNRKRKYLKTGFTFTVNDWDDFLTRKLQKHKDIKDTLRNYRDITLIPAISDLVEKNSFSFDGLDAKLGRAGITSLNEAFRKRISDLFVEDRVKYAESLESTLKSLESYSGKDIKFNSISVDYLKKYEKHLIDQGKSITTVGIYMRNIRTVINGDGEPYINAGKYPFGKNKYIIPKGEGRELALKLGEIHLIHNYRCTGTRELYRDMWLFSFYANGINITDLCRLRYEDIRDGEITFIRKKTKGTRRKVMRIYIPMVRPIKEIIRKHGNKSKDGYIFPFLNGLKTEKQIVYKVGDVTSLINQTIQEIAKELKLKDGITTYATRHSYVTILENMNVPRSFIKNSLGHANESVTDNYSNMADKEERYKYNSWLLPKNNAEVVKSLIETMELNFN